MSTFVSNLVHFVWGTANREPLLRKSWRDRLHGYIGGVLANKKAKLLAAGGIEDHIHVLASLPATMSLSQAASAMKANSSR
jgi:putative transposase